MTTTHTHTHANVMEIEQQTSRIRIAHLIVIFSALESALVNMFSTVEWVAPPVAKAFMLISIGASLLGWIVQKRSAQMNGARHGLLPIQLGVLALIQYGFIFLAPKLTIFFLLALLIVFASALVRLAVFQFAIGCTLYFLVSAIALWFQHERPDLIDLSNLQVAAIWLSLCLTLASFVFVRSQLGFLQGKLATTDEQLKSALVKIDALGRHDSLTGALNRRAIMETLDSELLRSKRTGHPFCFVIIDLDHFRAVNEKYGSTVGDQILKQVSDTSLNLLRALDRFGRMGGEEFGIILPATWLDQSVIAMGRLTKAVEACDWSQIAPGATITFSGGLTTNAVNDTAEIIVKRAEDALAKAKNEGRNRVVQAEEELPEMLPGMED